MEPEPMRLNPLVALSGMALAIALAGPAGAAKIYKWVDEKGVTHYGESIPPEYKDQAATEMTNQGMTVRKWGAAPTPEQRSVEAAKAVQEKEKEDKKQAFEQRRRDMALVNTYTSSREIDDARDRSLQLPMQAIKGLDPRLKRAQDKLAALQQQAAGYSHAGKPVPDAMEQDLEDQKLEVESMQAEMGRYRAQVDAIRAKFDADKRRYQELTQR
jgi:hypothetical protein